MHVLAKSLNRLAGDIRLLIFSLPLFIFGLGLSLSYYFTGLSLLSVSATIIIGSLTIAITIYKR